MMTDAKIKQELDDAPAPTTEEVVGSQTEGKPVKEEEVVGSQTEGKPVKEGEEVVGSQTEGKPVKEEEEVVGSQTEGKPVKEEEEAATEGKKEAAITGRGGIVSDPSALPDSNDPDEIRKQVEFYFSDSNLRFDKFLFGLVGKENKWVPLKMVASFKRMQRFKDFAIIQTALEASELLELNLQKTMVKRKVPLDTNVSYSKIREIQDQAQSRSLYAKGFGKETATTQFDIEKLFEPYGPISAVRLRRDEQRVFKGSVFVEFKNDELMEKFNAMEKKPKYKDQELTYMRKKDYVEMKIQDIKDGKIQAQDRKTYQNKKKHQFDALKLGLDNRGSGNGRGGGKKEKREGGHGGRGGRGRGRGGRGGRGRGGGKNGNAADDEHSIPKVQASEEHGVKRQREEDDNDVRNEDKKVKVEPESKEVKVEPEPKKVEPEPKKVKIERESTP